MSWNHRVMRHTLDKELWYAIHEVYYDEQGNPNGYSFGDVVGDDVEELKATLNLMLECLNKPILTPEDCGGEDDK